MRATLPVFSPMGLQQVPSAPQPQAPAAQQLAMSPASQQQPTGMTPDQRRKFTQQCTEHVQLLLQSLLLCRLGSLEITVRQRQKTKNKNYVPLPQFTSMESILTQMISAFGTDLPESIGLFTTDYQQIPAQVDSVQALATSCLQRHPSDAKNILSAAAEDMERLLNPFQPQFMQPYCVNISQLCKRVDVFSYSNKALLPSELRLFQLAVERHGEDWIAIQACLPNRGVEFLVAQGLKKMSKATRKPAVKPKSVAAVSAQPKVQAHFTPCQLPNGLIGVAPIPHAASFLSTTFLPQQGVFPGVSLAPATSSTTNTATTGKQNPPATGLLTNFHPLQAGSQVKSYPSQGGRSTPTRATTPTRRGSAPTTPTRGRKVKVKREDSVAGTLAAAASPGSSATAQAAPSFLPDEDTVASFLSGTSNFSKLMQSANSLPDEEDDPDFDVALEQADIDDDLCSVELNQLAEDSFEDWKDWFPDCKDPESPVAQHTRRPITRAKRHRGEDGGDDHSPVRGGFPPELSLDHPTDTDRSWVTAKDNETILMFIQEGGANAHTYNQVRALFANRPNAPDADSILKHYLSLVQQHAKSRPQVN
eukprot:NODE_590_length_2284_cov_83.045812_g560_i0.p1 GENE.NODE_590_length_2284_cov_83.045812_g560_i0~~NODE_590_length_2284_cov_83.045812_g560_i0.p1  ORF type:complete len:590 (+),score=95.43 NODE_590_length_2284_cov_83.045812_g560_i0:86-1855(+)